MAEMNHNLNEEQQGAAEEEEEKKITLRKEEDNEAVSDDSERTEEPVPKPAFNPETGELKINCRGLCSHPLHYVDRLIDSKEIVYGKKRMPLKIHCYICDNLMHGFIQAFYCQSGIKEHAPIMYLLNMQIHYSSYNLPNIPIPSEYVLWSNYSEAMLMAKPLDA